MRCTGCKLLLAAKLLSIFKLTAPTDAPWSASWLTHDNSTRVLDSGAQRPLE